jgi:SAM-dependent methyltransferase
MNTEANVAFWNARASLGEVAGTRDLTLKELERRAILGGIRECAAQNVLEVGCGRGETARWLFEELQTVHILGIDSSPAMMRETFCGARAGGSVVFDLGDAMAPPRGPWDVVYSQRCLINLPSWVSQKKAIDAIANVLVPGGRFLMCEHSQDGLDAINEARVAIGLSEINAPWHNKYFHASDLTHRIDSLELVECVPFSATYYYHSRVINAALAAKAGVEPDYDAEVNRLALTLPADCVDRRFAQGRLWIWEKA